MIADFHFIRPMALWLLPVGLALILICWKRRSNSSNWNEICDPHLIEPLLVGKSIGFNHLPFIGLILGWVLAIFAIAGPTWQQLPQPAHDQLQGRVIVFDLSLSMNSVDISPDRLTRARYKLNDLINKGVGLQQGLVVFAGDAFVVTPLTEDRETIANLSAALDTNTVPIQGSRTDLGLRMASTLLDNAGLQQGEIILITDGVHGDTAEVANITARKGHRVSVLAVGTEQGAPISLQSGEFLKDSNNQIVIPGVNFEQLREVANQGQGRFVMLASNDTDIDELSKVLPDKLDLKNTDSFASSQLTSDQWADKGPWLVLPLLIICALAFRRGWILSLLLIALPFNPNPAFAFGWDDLWYRDDQQAKQKIDQQKFDLVSPDAPAEWQAAAKYRNENYQEAAENYANSNQDFAITHYNHGNALAKSNSLTEAIAAYDQALELDPNLLEAQFNKELVEKLLQQQQENQQQSGESGNQKSSQENAQQQDQKSGKNSNSDEERETEAQNQNFDQGDDADESNSKQKQGQQKANKQTDQNQENSEESQDLAEDSSNNNNNQQDANHEGQTQLPMSEQQQAMEQWLKRIPDDPGGLLRRKFAYQNSLREPVEQIQSW